MFALACLLQLPLVLNPGYYSHDELQWAVYAADRVQVPWLDVSAFQYRPLTFNLWMLLSRALFDTPMLFHAVLVAAGALNAALLFAVGRGFGVPVRPAMAGALVFVLSPYAVYTHGWVGCIADVLWVGCALLLALCVQRTKRPLVAAFSAALFTGLALLAKEAAFAIPPLLALAWWFDGRKPKWLFAMLASGAVAALYLGLRIDVLLNAPREGSQYVLSAWHVPLRWLEYQIVPADRAAAGSDHHPAAPAARADRRASCGWACSARSGRPGVAMWRCSCSAASPRCCRCCRWPARGTITPTASLPSPR